MSDRAGNPTAAALYALCAVVLWGSLARLAVMARPMPSFLLTGSALLVAAVLYAPVTARSWRVSGIVLALGVYGLFGFHLFLFVALSLAPPLSANLINYLWPLLMVLLAPLVLGRGKLSPRHLLAGCIGFGGAALAITSTATSQGAPVGAFGLAYAGYACALASAFIWATYSLISQRLAKTRYAFPTGAIGLFCLVSGLLAVVCHTLFEPAYEWRAHDPWILLALGAGPMGAAFFLWDAALKRGNAAAIGALAYLTPLLSTALLALGHGPPGPRLIAAAFLIVGGALLGQLPSRRKAPD
jgi:drug/metabolite transporter (DMT)-like permease